MEVKTPKQNKPLKKIQVEVLNHEPSKMYLDTILQSINKALKEFKTITGIELQEQELQKLIKNNLTPADLLKLEPYNAFPAIVKNTYLNTLEHSLKALKNEIAKLYYNVRQTSFLQYAELVQAKQTEIVKTPTADEQIKSLFEVYITDENKLKSYYKALEIAKQLQELEKELNLPFDRIFNYDLFAQSYEINKHEFLDF